MAPPARPKIYHILHVDRLPSIFAQRKTLSDTGPAVIWIRLPNTRRRELLARFESVLPDVLSALERGEALIEVI